MTTTQILHFVARSRDPVEPRDYCTRELARFRQLSLEQQEAVEADWQAQADAEHAAWLASGEPDRLAESMAKRKADRVAAEAEWDVIDATYRRICSAIETTEAEADAAFDDYESAMAAWHRRFDRLWPNYRRAAA